jgi:hypothetical protein
VKGKRIFAVDVPAAEEGVAWAFVDHFAIAGVGTPFGLDLPSRFYLVTVKPQFRARALCE